MSAAVSFVLLVAAMCGFVSAGEFSWATTYAPLKFWHTVSSDASGANLFAVAFEEYLYRSTDSGTTWFVAFNRSAYWTAGASNAAGDYLVATSLDIGIQYSIDSGKTWYKSYSPTVQTWSAIAISPNGVNASATAKNGQIYFSQDACYSFRVSPSSPVAVWVGIAMNAKNQHIAVAPYDPDQAASGIWYYLPSVGAWEQGYVPNSATLVWTGIAYSTNGNFAFASCSTGFIFVSTDQGATWTMSSAPANPWSAVTVDSTGQYIVATTGNTASNGYIYTSKSYGVNWTVEETPSLNWYSLASNANGKKVVVTCGSTTNGQIYVNRITGAPTLSPTSYQYGYEDSEALSSGAIAGIVIGGLAVVSAVLGVLFCYYEHKYNATKQMEDDVRARMSGKTPAEKQQDTEMKTDLIDGKKQRPVSQAIHQKPKPPTPEEYGRHTRPPQPTEV